MTDEDAATQAAIDAGEWWLHRDLLPGESIDGGLYLHGVHVMRTTENVVVPCGAEKTEPAERLWVPADEFMAVQKERDDYRRALAFVNEQEVTDRDWSRVRRVLARVGLTPADGAALASISAWVRSEAAK